jgi:hypothetical protein
LGCDVDKHAGEAHKRHDYDGSAEQSVRSATHEDRMTV